MGYHYEKIKDIKRNAEFTAGARAVLRGRWADAIGATGGIPFAMGIIGILAGIICYGVVTASLILNGAETGAMTIVIAMILTALVTGSLRWASYVYSVAAIRWDLGLISGEDTSIVRSCKTALKLYTKVFLANLAAALIVLGKYLLLIVPGILSGMRCAAAGHSCTATAGSFSASPCVFGVGGSFASSRWGSGSSGSGPT